MTENVIFAALFFPAAAAVLIFSMKYLAEIMQARARFNQDASYRELALKAATAQSEMATALTEIQARLSSLEKILKEVE